MAKRSSSDMLDPGPQKPKLTEEMKVIDDEITKLKSTCNHLTQRNPHSTAAKKLIEQIYTLEAQMAELMAEEEDHMRDDVQQR